MFPRTGILAKAVCDGWMFLAVEQSVSYLKPIRPFQRYSIETSIKATHGKWLHYEHRFLQTKDSVASGQDPILYAIVNMKAVIKRKNGKTIKILELKDASPFNNELVEIIE